jgi:hypothetical protein
MQLGTFIRGGLFGFTGRSRILVLVRAVGMSDSAVVVLAAAVPRCSSASAKQVQPQPRAGTCHAHGPGLYELPDYRCTPGLRNPAATPRTIHSTICVTGWTSRVRPSESITSKDKRASMAACGDKRSISRYEYDHLIPLELGGAVAIIHRHASSSSDAGKMYARCFVCLTHPRVATVCWGRSESMFGGARDASGVARAVLDARVR